MERAGRRVSWWRRSVEHFSSSIDSVVEAEGGGKFGRRGLWVWER